MFRAFRHRRCGNTTLLGEGGTFSVLADIDDERGGKGGWRVSSEGVFRREARVSLVVARVFDLERDRDLRLDRERERARMGFMATGAAT